MAVDPGPGAPAVNVGATRVSPTVFGVVLATALVLAVALRPATADPSLTGLVLGATVGFVLVGLVWPLIVTRRLTLVVTGLPDHLVVGQLGTLEVEVQGRGSGLALSCAGSGLTVLDVGPGAVRLPFSVQRRGVYRQIRVELSSDAPFGVLRVQRTRTLDLPAELLVGPPAVEHRVGVAHITGDDRSVQPVGVALRGDSVRSVRPYVAGDPSHLVHWPTSARTGSLVVRELEPPASEGVALVVDLRDPSGGADPDAVESAAGRAQGAIEGLLRAGSRVMLCTSQADGPLAVEITGADDALRRLARADSGLPAGPPSGWSWVTIGVGT